MPLYAYKCDTCRITFDVVHGFSSMNDQVCPKCQAPATRVYTASNFIIRGGGTVQTKLGDWPDHNSWIDQ